MASETKNGQQSGAPAPQQGQQQNRPPRPPIEPIFAAYYQVRDLPRAQALHDDLIAVARRECKTTGGKASAKATAARSLGNIFNRPDPVLKVFRQILTGAANDFLSEYLPRVFARKPQKLRIDVGGWAYILKPGDFLNPHVHQDGVISGTYYLKLPENVGPEHGGQLVLMNPNIASLMSQAPMPAKDNMRPEIKEGSVVFFPSYIPHYVQAFDGAGERIVYAFDVRLRTVSGQGPQRSVGEAGPPAGAAGKDAAESENEPSAETKSGGEKTGAGDKTAGKKETGKKTTGKKTSGKKQSGGKTAAKSKSGAGKS